MPQRWPLHLLLFVLTCGTTFLVGGPSFAAALMVILLSHEMGHYLQARRYGVPATLPFFIPLPLPPFGTMGAVIRMNQLGADRRVLFDIGVTGPLAGLALAVPLTLWGLAHSMVIPLDSPEVGLELGDSLLMQAMVRLVVGLVPEGHDVLLHPVAFAGWAGLFVTALNLLPIGQLDGGHVAYAILGRARARRLALAALAGFILVAVFVSPIWTVMAVLVLVMGPGHPPTADDTVPLGRVRRWVGYAALLFCVLSFPPDPFRFH